MSTNFGIPLRQVDIEFGDEGGIFDYINEEFFQNVAHRSNSGKLYWSSSQGQYLSDKTRVYALNNSQQGIYTIGDIRNKINNQ